MKKIIMSAGIASLLLSCAPREQQGYKITATVDGLPDNAIVVLRYRLNGETINDSAYVRNKKFEFSDTVAYPFRANLLTGQGNRVDYLPLYVEPCEITITSPDSLKNAVITGSPINDDEALWNAAIKDLTDTKNDILTKYREATTDEEREEMTARYQEADSLEKVRAKEFIQRHPGSFISLDALFMSVVGYNPDAKDAEELYNIYTPELQQTKAGQELAAKIARWRQTSIGSIAPDFTQNDPDGKPVSLKDFRGKYLLIDFWASWCGPCRAENPNVVKAYNRFKDKGFTILGVSLDNENGRERWLKAIEDDNLTWTQVSDLKYWNNAAAKLYEVNAIPANFLLDPEGKIIGRNLRGEALTNKLAEVMP
jgi:peroxiredoxin